MRPGHIALNVKNLDRATEFYSGVFGWDVLAREESFVFLGDSGGVVLTLWRAGDEPLHHVAFEVGSIEDARDAETRVKALGGRMHYDGVVAHREGSASGGIFFTDPDGIRLEIYAPQGSDGHAPHAHGPACGFF